MSTPNTPQLPLDLTDTTPEPNAAILTMKDTTNKKLTSSSEHATISSSSKGKDPASQHTDTSFNGTQTSSAVPASNSSTLSPSTSTQTTTPTTGNPSVLQPKYHTPISLASTTTDAPPSPTFTPLRPIHHWVPPRPAIISRTEASEAEKAELRAEDAARKAEKREKAARKEAEMEVSREAARKADEERRGRELGELGERGYGSGGRRGRGQK